MKYRFYSKLITIGTYLLTLSELNDMLHEASSLMYLYMVWYVLSKYHTCIVLAMLTEAWITKSNTIMIKSNYWAVCNYMLNTVVLYSMEYT